MSDLPIHQSKITTIDAQSMGADITGTAVNINETVSYAFQIIWSAGSTPVGDIVLQGSNDNSTFTEIVRSNVTGNSGSTIINVEKPSYAWARVNYSRTSGSGTMSATMNNKRA